MRIKIGFRTLIVSLLLLCGTGELARSQIVETRRGESNPAGVIFHSTLYGAATGGVLGGAYCLIKGHQRTWDVLRWSIAGGTAAGLLIGLIYVTARPAPTGSGLAEDPWIPESERLGAGPLLRDRNRDALGRSHPVFQLPLMHVRW